MVASKVSQFKNKNGKTIVITFADVGLKNPTIAERREATKEIQQLRKDAANGDDAAKERLAGLVDNSLGRQKGKKGEIDPWKVSNTGYKQTVSFKGKPDKEGFRKAEYGINVFRTDPQSLKSSSEMKMKEGFVKGDFAYSKGKDYKGDPNITITHLPSGFIIATVGTGQVLRSKNQPILARKMINEFNKLDLSALSPLSNDISGLTKETKERAQEIGRMTYEG